MRGFAPVGHGERAPVTGGYPHGVAGEVPVNMRCSYPMRALLHHGHHEDGKPRLTNAPFTVPDPRSRPSAASQCSKSEVPMRSRSNDETFQPHQVSTGRKQVQGEKPVFCKFLTMLTAGDRRPPPPQGNGRGTAAGPEGRYSCTQRMTRNDLDRWQRFCSIFLSRVPYRFSPPPRRTRGIDHIWARYGGRPSLAGRVVVRWVQLQKAILVR